ncbi:MAG TPA: hypothetical protein VI248_25510 [Kineosporiaceae bacterium]
MTYQAVTPRHRPFATPDRAALALHRIGHRVFPRGTTVPDDTASAALSSDLARMASMPLDPRAAPRAGSTFAEMAAPLVAEFLEPDESVDLVVLASATPDLLPAHQAAPSVLEALPGDPLAFGITDQGRGAAFTAVDLAQRCARRHGHRRAVVLLFDQALLPYDGPSDLSQRVDASAAAAVVLTAPPPDRIGGRAGGSGRGCQVRHQATVPPDEVLRRAFAPVDPEVLGNSPDVVLGAGVDPGLPVPIPGAHVVRDAPGLPSTGVWRAVAHRNDPGAARPLIVVDANPVTDEVWTFWTTGRPTRP